jgi:hypothetical protein
LLQSPCNNFFHDNRSQFPDIRNQTWVDVRVLRTQARLPALRHRLIRVLIKHGGCGIAIPELEMVVR